MSSGQPGSQHAALEQYRRAELVFRQANDQLRMASITQNMGLAYTDLGEFELAQAMFQTSIEYQRQRGNRRGIANSLDGLGVVLRAQGNRAAAEATFREALELLDTLAGQPGDRLAQTGGRGASQRDARRAGGSCQRRPVELCSQDG